MMQSVMKKKKTEFYSMKLHQVVKPLLSIVPLGIMVRSVSGKARLKYWGGKLK
jgi:hypothetical protein